MKYLHNCFYLIGVQDICMVLSIHGFVYTPDILFCVFCFVCVPTKKQSTPPKQ